MGERDVQEERNKWIAWRVAAKGRGYRWSLQRTLVTILAVTPLTTTSAQALMTFKHGMLNATTHRMLTELREAGALEQFLEDGKGYYWRATERGVTVYLGSRKAIPAVVVRELLSLVNVNELEE